MRFPLGTIDTRVTMTDSPLDGVLSPSFASVLTFDNAQTDPHALDDDNYDSNDITLEEQRASDEVRSTRRREWGSPRRCPRLELDVALDKYHFLDGFTEPSNPQNTPASFGGGDSSGEGLRRRTENIRSSSAPGSTQSAYDWDGAQLSGGLMDLPDNGDDGLKAQRHRPSVSEKQKSASPTAPFNDKPRNGKLQPVNGSHGTSSIRYVRFTPPLDSPPSRVPRSPQRPLPSVERRQDYITSYRQKKQLEKWKGASRLLGQRMSPCRSPPKSSQSPTRPFNHQPDIRFSSLTRTPFFQDKSSTVSTNESNPAPQNQGAESQTIEYIRNASADTKTHDLVSLSFSLNHRQAHEADVSRPFSSLFQIRISFTIAPMSSHLLRQSIEAQEVASSVQPPDQLLLHINLVVPAFLLRVPFAIILFVNRAARSRMGAQLLQLAGSLWALATLLFNAVFSKLSGLEISSSTNSVPRNSNRASRVGE